jgi:hypothetical protein
MAPGSIWSLPPHYTTVVTGGYTYSPTQEANNFPVRVNRQGWDAGSCIRQGQSVTSKRPRIKQRVDRSNETLSSQVDTCSSSIRGMRVLSPQN